MSDRRAFRRPCREEAFRGSPQAEARGAPIPEIHGFESAKPLRDFGAAAIFPPGTPIARAAVEVLDTLKAHHGYRQKEPSDYI